MPLQSRARTGESDQLASRPRRSAARSLGDPAEFTCRGPESAGQVAPLTSLPGSSAPQPRETQKHGARGPDSPWATRVAARCRANPHRARSHWPQVAALRPTGSPSCALIIGPRSCGPPRIGSGGGPEELPLATGAACPRGLAVGTVRFRPCPARPPPRAPPKFRGVGAAGAVGPALRAPFRVPPSAPPGNPALRWGAASHGPSALDAALTAAGGARHAQQDGPQDGRERRPRPSEGALRRVSARGARRWARRGARRCSFGAVGGAARAGGRARRRGGCDGSCGGALGGGRREASRAGRSLGLWGARSGPLLLRSSPWSQAVG